MTTLETFIEDKLVDLGAKDGSEASIEYMLQCMPYIRDYDTDQPSVSATLPGQPGTIDSAIILGDTSNRKKVFDTFLHEIEGVPDDTAHLTGTNYDCYECPTCRSIRVFMEAESTLLCESCGVSEYIIEGSTRNLTYDEEITARSNGNSFTYLRINHFVEHLNSLQAKELTEIPDEVIDALKLEFKKHGYTTRADITCARVKTFLKKMRLSRYYDHAYHILSQLNGVPPPVIPAVLEEKLKQMFMLTQAPFNKHKPATRKNYLKYSYVLYKFCQILGETQYLKYFHLLKSTQKLFQQDEIWKKICMELDWPFFPSI